MLKIEHLKKAYQNFSLDCSLQVPKGQITGLIGKNGAGKSTVFKAILGLIATDSGTITLLGKDIKQFTPKDKERLGVVLSDSGFSGYLTVVAFGTVSYDEFDNGNAFLFTLPISRKLYVAEKYLLTLLAEIFSFALAVIIALIFGLVKSVSVWDTLVDSPIVFALATILFSFMLPIRLKFDSEKGRTVTLIMIGVFVLVGLGFVQLSEMLHIDTDQWFIQFSQLNLGIVMALAMVAAIIAGLISMKISIAIVNKKEF